MPRVSKKTVNEMGTTDGNSNSNNNTKTNVNINFNKLLFNAVKDKQFKVKKNNKSSKNSYNLYESSFDDINKFRSSFTKKEVDEIDAIIYHDENNDGMFSAAIVYHYLKEANPDKIIELITEKPGKFTFRDKIVGKNIIILDL